MQDLAAAIAIAMFIEGAAWSLFPGAMKRAVVSIVQQPLALVRLVGLAVALGGVLVLWLLRG